MDAFSNVPPHQKAELMQHIEGEQLKESLRCDVCRVSYYHVAKVDYVFLLIAGCITLLWKAALTAVSWSVGEA